MEKRLFVSFRFLDGPCCPAGSELGEEYQIYDARNLFNGEFCISEAVLQAEIFGRNYILFNLANMDCFDDDDEKRGFHILKGVFHYLYPKATFFESRNAMIIDYESDLDAQDILDDLKLLVLR